MHQRRLADEVEHPHARIERGHRILEDHLQLELDAPPGRAVERVERRAAEANMARARRIDVGGRAAEGRLAAAGLADQPHHLAFADREIDVGDRLDGRLALAGAEQVGGARRQIERPHEALAHAVECDDRLLHAVRSLSAWGCQQRLARPAACTSIAGSVRMPRRRACSAERRCSPAAGRRQRAGCPESARAARRAGLRRGAAPISPRV